MEDINVKLEMIYKLCINEMKSIGIDFGNSMEYGEISILLAKRKSQSYGICKHLDPDLTTKYIEKGKLKVRKYKRHEIYISKWVMELDDEIISNTIIHELIHCIPGCNNHGVNFKKIATYINDNTSYSIQRTGNIEEDYKKSNKEYVKIEKKKQEYKYKIVCTNCKKEFFRVRVDKKKFKKYRCAYCLGKFKIEDL